MLGADIASSGEGATDGGQSVGNTGENVLVLAEAEQGDAADYCAERISGAPGAVSPNALLVSLDEDPDNRYNTVVGHGAGTSTDVGLVCCDRTRSTAAAQPTGTPGLSPGPWIATVSSPADLTGIGTRIEQALSAWADTPESVELCFHSLTTLCEHVDERSVFRFCHALTRHLRTVGASSHFHLDPSVVDEQTVSMLSELFDRVEDRT